MGLRVQKLKICNSCKLKGVSLKETEKGALKAKLNSIEVLKALIELNISHDEIVLVNIALKKYCDMKKVKKLKT